MQVRSSKIYQNQDKTNVEWLKLQQETTIQL